MKTNKFTLLAILALGGLTAFGTLAQAQDSTNTPPPGARQRPPGGPGARMGKLAQDLGLSEDQQSKWTVVMKEQAEKRKALQDLPAEERKTKGQALREETTTKIKGILTPEQFTKFQEMTKNRRGPGGPGGPGAPKPEAKN